MKAFIFDYDYVLDIFVYDHVVLNLDVNLYDHFVFNDNSVEYIANRSPGPHRGLFALY